MNAQYREMKDVSIQSDEWEQMTLGEYAKIVMGQSPSSQNYTTNPTDIPFLQGNRTFGQKYPKFNVYTTLGAKFARRGNVLLSVRAPVGDVNMAESDICIGRGVCALSSYDEDNEFLYYLIKNLEGSLIQIQNGSTFGSVNKNDLAELQIRIPNKNARRKIGYILSTIDSKIQLNQQINENLLNCAKCAFTKMMESSTKRDGSLSDVANITMGQSPPGESLSTTDGKLFFQGRAEFGTFYPTPKLYTTQPKRIAPKGSVLVSVRAPVGDINLALEECCIGRGLAAIVSKHGTQGYIHYLMDYLKPQLDTFNSDGTVFGSINKDSINDLPISIPEKSAMMKYNEYATIIDKQIEIRHLETLKLIELRDYLLPKLMDGEIKTITGRQSL